MCATKKPKSYSLAMAIVPRERLLVWVTESDLREGVCDGQERHQDEQGSGRAERGGRSGPVVYSGRYIQEGTAAFLLARYTTIRKRVNF